MKNINYLNEMKKGNFDYIIIGNEKSEFNVWVSKGELIEVWNYDKIIACENAKKYSNNGIIDLAKIKLEIIEKYKSFDNENERNKWVNYNMFERIYKEESKEKRNFQKIDYFEIVEKLTDRIESIIKKNDLRIKIEKSRISSSFYLKNDNENDNNNQVRFSNHRLNQNDYNINDYINEITVFESEELEEYDKLKDYFVYYESQGYSLFSSCVLNINIDYGTTEKCKNDFENTIKYIAKQLESEREEDE